MHTVKRYLAQLFNTRDRRGLQQALQVRLKAAGHHPNPNKLYALIDQGICSPGIYAQITEALPAQQAEGFRNALREEEQRLTTSDEPPADFRPYLWVLNERRVPSPIFVVGLTGIDFWKVIPLPGNIGDEPPETQRQQVAEHVERHYRKWGESTATFGPVLGYVYVPTPQRCHFVTTEGVFDAMPMGPFPRPRVGVSLSIR